MSNISTDSSVYVFTDGQRIAVIVNGIIGTISTLTVFGLLLHLFTVSFVSSRGANKDERIFLRMHLGAFVVCLLLSDLIQGMSGMIQLIWASKRQVTVGPLCTAQAAMIQFGDVGTAFWNAVVAIHTFWTVVLGKRMSTVAVAFLIATGWTLSVVLTAIGPLAIQTAENGPFYAIAGGWCFVTGNYKYPRIYVHYLPMLLSASIITVLYALVALVLFGVLVVDGSKWRFKAPTRQSTNFIRDFFGQFSWGRLHRPSTGNTQTVSQNSAASKTASGGRVPGSIRLGSLPPRTSDVKAGLDVPEGPSAVATIQTVDIVQRPDTGTTGGSDNSTSVERGRKATAKTIGEPKATLQPQTQMPTNQLTGRTLQLKTLAIKMLWYPIVYIVLILPIAVTRVDPSVKVSLEVMLSFMCLLWLMGTANTVIYVCTRRLGPTPWSRRTLSTSRSRSKGARTEENKTTHEQQQQHLQQRSVAPVQIFVDRFTQHATDDQFIEIAREKSAGSSVTGADIPVISALPSLSHRDNKEMGVRDYRDSKVEFDFGSTRHAPRQGSVSSTSAANNYSLPRQPSQNQEPSTYTYTLPRPIQPPHDSHPVAYQEPHPYSRAQSPTLHQHRTSHDPHASFPPYYYEDDDDSLRTQSRTHSRKGSANGKGIGMGF